MDAQKIIQLIWEENQVNSEKYAQYCVRLSLEKDKDWELKNPWMSKKSDETLATLYKRVASEGLVFDGVHITLQSTGVSYDYVAFKNKMYLVYPETQFDAGLVYKEDEFSFSKNDWKVTYSHKITNPFSQKDQYITGAYAVVRNKRGEYITLLSREDLEKHKKTAKTKYIWDAWYAEMCLKTIVKKACKLHFGDIFTWVEEMDNENYDVAGLSKETISEKLNRPDSTSK